MLTHSQALRLLSAAAAEVHPLDTKALVKKAKQQHFAALAVYVRRLGRAFADEQPLAPGPLTDPDVVMAAQLIAYCLVNSLTAPTWARVIPPTVKGTDKRLSFKQKVRAYFYRNFKARLSSGSGRFSAEDADLPLLAGILAKEADLPLLASMLTSQSNRTAMHADPVNLDGALADEPDGGGEPTTRGHYSPWATNQIHANSSISPDHR